jgi:methylated-DNA-[protein]-cysteine S-methyltransferase
VEYRSYFETELGTGAVIASEQGIRRVELPSAGACGSTIRSGLDKASPLTERVAEMLKLYFKGQPQFFNEIPVDLGGLSDFRARILTLIRAIPHGEVKSYGEVAIMAGAPGAARAVGGALAANPAPIIIPCHRVVGGNGNLTGFTAPGGLHLKKIILQMEHIEFTGEVVCMKGRKLLTR